MAQPSTLPPTDSDNPKEDATGSPLPPIAPPPTDADLPEKDRKTIDNYLLQSALISRKILFNSTDNDIAKVEKLQTVSNSIMNFIELLKDSTKHKGIITYLNSFRTEQVGSIYGLRKTVPSLEAIRERLGIVSQSGGADDFTFSKIYNTQGLIVDDNDPIKNASSYINTADQIPQPFSSVSSGATYSSGLEPAFLQDVLPVLNMAGGMKQKLKSKRARK